MFYDSHSVSAAYFLYHIWTVFMRFTFFCSWRMPYISASAVGGQPADGRQRW